MLLGNMVLVDTYVSPNPNRTFTLRRRTVELIEPRQVERHGPPTRGNLPAKKTMPCFYHNWNASCLLRDETPLLRQPRHLFSPSPSPIYHPAPTLPACINAHPSDNTAPPAKLPPPPHSCQAAVGGDGPGGAGGRCAGAGGARGDGHAPLRRGGAARGVRAGARGREGQDGGLPQGAPHQRPPRRRRCVRASRPTDLDGIETEAFQTLLSSLLNCLAHFPQEEEELFSSLPARRRRIV
jgi:hypothetical protein